MTTLIADCEADNLLRDMTRVWCLSLADVRSPDTITTYADQPGWTPLAKGFARLAAAERVVFHNGYGFDLPAINSVAPGTLRYEQIIDTLVLSRLLNPELNGGHSLDAWARRLGLSKPQHDEWDRFSDEMAHRNREDVAILIKLYEKLGAYPEEWAQSVELEHQVAYVISLQEQNGFTLNVDKAERLAAELRQEQTDIERRLQEMYPPWWCPKVTGGSAVFTPKRDHAKNGYVAGVPFTKVVLEPFNPGSRKQIEKRLSRNYGWKPTKFNNTGGAKLDETTLNEIAVEFPEARPMARYFRLEKQLGQISDGKNGWLKLVRPDGRVHGAVNPNGAVTGRMSHFNPNLANVDKKDKRMREVWEPRAGWKLVGADASGLELRMLGHYLGRYDDGAYLREVVDGDVHALTQKAVLDHAGYTLSRDGIKTLTYATLYGCGDRKRGLIVIQDYLEKGLPRPKGSPTAIGKKVIGALLSGIVGFEQLTNLCKAKHRTQGWIRGLDGRRIITRSEHAALNTLLQGAGAVVMKKALAIFHFELVNLSTYGVSWNYCVNVHDEVQIEADPQIADHIGILFTEAIKQAGERLGVRCPLDGEHIVGANWKETH